ncbi:MAG: tetratricopeptide repeat protein [Acidobacteriota bacterium]
MDSQVLVKRRLASSASFVPIVEIRTSRFAAKQPEEAERVFKEAVQKHPESVKAFLALGNFYVFSGDFEKAESAFQKAYDLAPQSGQTLLALVRLYVAEHQPDQAVGVLQKAIQSSKDPIPLQISLADFYLSLHRDQDAVDLLQELHSEHPDREDVNVHLAEVQQRLGRTEDASRTVDAFLEKNPNSGSGHLLRGRLDAAENNFDGARAEVDRGARRDRAPAGPHRCIPVEGGSSAAPG